MDILSIESSYATFAQNKTEEETPSRHLKHHNRKNQNNRKRKNRDNRRKRKKKVSSC
jgi:hypothetical protein